VPGSISVQVFSYRRRLGCESSKTFHFFPRCFLLQGRIFYSKYLCCKDVRQVFQFVFAELSSALRFETRRAITTLFRRRGQPSIAASN